MALSKSISFRAPLQGEVQDVLAEIGIECVQTTATVVDLIVELGRYEEEGTQLFPQILLCNSLPQALGVLAGEEPIYIADARARATGHSDPNFAPREVRAGLARFSARNSSRFAHRPPRARARDRP